MLVKTILLNMFFIVAAQVSVAQQYQNPPEIPPSPGQVAEQQPPPTQEPQMEPLEEHAPPPEDYPQMADEPPPPDYLDHDPGNDSAHFGSQPVTPYKALKILKKPAVAKRILPSQQRVVAGKKIARTVATGFAKKKSSGIKSVKPYCSMREMANSKSKELGKTRSRSRLWVEEVNSSWFKVYRRAGAAFISASCLL